MSTTKKDDKIDSTTKVAEADKKEEEKVPNDKFFGKYTHAQLS